MRILCLLLLLPGFFTLQGQKKGLIESKWVENVGSEYVMTSADFIFLKKAKLLFYISNSEERIYIDIKIEDPALQTIILRQGLTLWINMDGKKIKTKGIRFPIGSLYSGIRGRKGAGELPLEQDGPIATPLSVANVIELVGFTGEPARRFPAENAETFSGSIKYDEQGILCYNMILPIEKVPVRNSKSGDGAMPFAIGIEYGAPPDFTSQRNPSGNSQPGGMSSDRSGGRSTGGIRPGGGAGRPGMGGVAASASGMSQNQSQIVLEWLKGVKLAGK